MSLPLLSIFVDGLRYDSLRYMPFVNSLNHIQLKSILGYSITCHPTMYSGVFPDKHKIVFHWIKKNNMFGPLLPLSYFPDIVPFSNPSIQAIISYCYSKIFLKTSAFMGYNKIMNLPMRYWKYLDINENKYWYDDNYLGENIKTIFEILRLKKIKYYLSGMSKNNLGKLDYHSDVSPDAYSWIYYFVGEADHLSHVHTQHSEITSIYLRKLDIFIENRYKEYEQIYGCGNFTFLLWSDHGHIPIEKRYNLYDIFEKKGCNLKSIMHIIDSTTVRFWISAEDQMKLVQEVMLEVPGVNIVGPKDYEILHLPTDHNLCGDLLFYLDGGYIFSHTIHGFGLKTKSMHGYHPDTKGNEGVFISNRHILATKATLPDVFVSSIKSLGITYEPENGLDGKNILS